MTATISGGIPAGTLTEPERQRYLAQARRMGQTIERLRAENERLRASIADCSGSCRP